MKPDQIAPQGGREQSDLGAILETTFIVKGRARVQHS